ncbi:unnamed protein product [Rotaria socialis]
MTIYTTLILVCQNTCSKIYIFVQNGVQVDKINSKKSSLWIIWHGLMVTAETHIFTIGIKFFLSTKLEINFTDYIFKKKNKHKKNSLIFF